MRLNRIKKKITHFSFLLLATTHLGKKENYSHANTGIEKDGLLSITLDKAHSFLSYSHIDRLETKEERDVWLASL